MTKVVVDSALQSALRNFQEEIELYDAEGNLVGRFYPNIPAKPYEPFLSEEELVRRENEEPDYSLKEVLEHLRKL